MGLAWLHSGPTSLYSDAVWLGSLPFPSPLGSEYLGAGQVEGGAKGAMSLPPPPLHFSRKSNLILSQLEGAHSLSRGIMIV